MKILIASPACHPDPGGVERYTHDLATSMLACGHDVALLTLKDYSPESRTPGISYHSVVVHEDGTTSGKIRQKLAMVVRVHRLMSAIQAEQVIVVSWDPLAYLFTLLRRRHGYGLTLVAHGQEVTSLLRPEALVKRVVFQRIFEHADCCIAVSAYTAAAVRSVSCNARVFVVPNGLTDQFIDTAGRTCGNEIRQAMNIPEGTFVILQVGRLVPRKNHALVLASLHRLLDGGLNAVYHIVGDGPERDALMRRATQLHLGDRVVMHQRIDDATLHALYGACNVVVMPSWNSRRPEDVEGFGIVFLEAYAHMRPVVGTRNGGIPDVILHDQTGYLADPGDPSELTERLGTLAMHPERGRLMGQRGHALLLERWRWNVLAKSIANLWVQT